MHLEAVVILLGECLAIVAQPGEGSCRGLTLAINVVVSWDEVHVDRRWEARGPHALEGANLRGEGAEGTTAGIAITSLSIMQASALVRRLSVIAHVLTPSRARWWVTCEVLSHMLTRSPAMTTAVAPFAASAARPKRAVSSVAFPLKPI